MVENLTDHSLASLKNERGIVLKKKNQQALYS